MSISSSSTRNCFFRKTRRGDVIKQVNETYVHNDFSYGYLHGQKLLAGEFRSIVENSTSGRIVVLDTNILLHHMDILEASSNTIQTAIIPQTALSELRNLNLSVYKRALSLFKDETRQFVFYPNVCASNALYQRYTYFIIWQYHTFLNCVNILNLCSSICPPRLRNESPNDYNDRLIVQCCASFASLDSGLDILLLTNDFGNQVSQSFLR